MMILRKKSLTTMMKMNQEMTMKAPSSYTLKPKVSAKPLKSL